MEAPVRELHPQQRITYEISKENAVEWAKEIYRLAVEDLKKQKREPELRTCELAGLLNVSDKTIRQWLKDDPGFPHHRTVGGRLRFYESKVREYITRSA